jgi:hypothetical protein
MPITSRTSLSINYHPRKLSVGVSAPQNCLPSVSGFRLSRPLSSIAAGSCRGHMWQLIATDLFLTVYHFFASKGSVDHLRQAAEHRNWRCGRFRRPWFSSLILRSAACALGSYGRTINQPWYRMLSRLARASPEPNAGAAPPSAHSAANPDAAM